MAGPTLMPSPRFAIGLTPVLSVPILLPSIRIFWISWIFWPLLRLIPSWMLPEITLPAAGVVPPIVALLAPVT